MAQPTEGEWRVLGTSQIYAGNKMIGISAIKDVPDLAERVANLELMAAAKDLLEALEACYKSLATYGPHPLIKARVNAAIAKARKTELQTKQ